MRQTRDVHTIDLETNDIDIKDRDTASWRVLTIIKVQKRHLKYYS